MRWSGTVVHSNIEILPVVPLRVAAASIVQPRRRYRVKSEFWGWLAVAAIVGYEVGSLVYALMMGRF